MNWAKRLLGISDVPRYTREQALELSADEVFMGLGRYLIARAPLWKKGLAKFAQEEGVDPKYLAYVMLRPEWWPRQADTPKMRFARLLFAHTGVLSTAGMVQPASEEAAESALLRFAKALEGLEGDVSRHFDQKLLIPAGKKYKKSLRRDNGRGSMLNDAIAQIAGYFRHHVNRNTSNWRILVLDAVEAFDL